MTELTADEILALQDTVMISIRDGKLDHYSLRQLPTWRAVLLAEIAYRARVMSRADRDKLQNEARLYGELKPARMDGSRPARPD